ncbi:deoxyribodipyrimidine photo-lyase [[Enterobacter] lignolyticus]|uniref:Deoxyribodipyrimidine photo-lyase n=1 Tax=[Enterobacter] lignolyticus TaxID=1334193 RepID=A0A806X8Q8_9ENTR|nr:deoxyribodipyrimidine photo-lyase [[Enterobacter] lignolyticus]ALR76003.1 deoxyribodipyrimidine photolyase [[Enterobacter] lignolyticus]
MTTHLVWFRTDLRLHDNLALAAACRDSYAKVLALFIATPGQWRQHRMAPRQAAYIQAQLNDLQRNLADKGIPLLLREAEDFAASVQVIQQVCNEHKVSSLFYNYQYELNERRRDARVEKALKDVLCQGFDDSVMLAPGSVMTGDRQMYKVFTPFKNAYLKRLKEGLPECVRAPSVREEGAIKVCQPLKLNYPQTPFDPDLFPADEKSAIARLRQFCQQQAAEYEQKRDFPAMEGTSRLSCCLTVGVLSPRQCLRRLLAECSGALEGGAGSVWLNELIWREFYRHLMTFHPELCRFKPFIKWTDNVKWCEDNTRLNAWQRGQTGYPIVDAAMRQLNDTGWMHNRLRMIVASFLVKDLLIDWREGERYFMSQLVDGDLAANNGGWQWAASTGTDAAPYFRIFNPTTQGEKFDKQGEFIRRWLPELRDVPDKALHSPWQWADKEGGTIDYPRPIVDHPQARLETLAAYEAARKG